MKKMSKVVLILSVIISSVCWGAEPKLTTIQVMMTDMRLPDYPQDQDVNQMPFMRAMEVYSGIDLEVEVVSHEEYPKKVRLALASGNLPDVYNTYSIYDRNFPEAIHSGIAIPLDEYIDQYGPNLKAKIPEHVWDSVRVNGKIYAIPEVLIPSTTRRGLFIRKDWLDQLGVEVPETVEEFMEVLRLFKEHDLNGNGEADEIPYIGRQHLEWMEVFFGAYGVLPRGWRYQDGAFQPDIVTPEFKQALGTVRDMYAEGLLDPEFIVNTGAMWEHKILSGRVGMWEHIGSWLSTWQQAVEEKNPGAEVIIIPSPLGPWGERGTGKYPPYLRIWFVTRAAENPAAVVQFFDWLVSEEGQSLVKFGLQGVNYQIRDGKMNWKPENDPDSAWRSVLFRMVNDSKMDWGYEKMKDPVNGARFEEATRILEQEGVNNPGYSMQIPQTLLDNPELAVPGGVLFKSVVFKIILGLEPLERYDQFVQEWLEQGGAEAVKEATRWYEETQRYKQMSAW